jgi:hypothetical protein
MSGSTSGRDSVKRLTSETPNLASGFGTGNAMQSLTKYNLKLTEWMSIVIHESVVADDNGFYCIVIAYCYVAWHACFSICVHVRTISPSVHIQVPRTASHMLICTHIQSSPPRPGITFTLKTNGKC